MTQSVFVSKEDDLQEAHQAIEESLSAFRKASTQVVSGLFGRFSIEALVKGLDADSVDEVKIDDGQAVPAATAETMFLLYL